MNWKWMNASAIAVTLGSVLVASPAFAQVADAPSPAAQAADQSAADTGIGDIIVTAQRRSESAQDVPIAVTALSGDQMAQIGLASSADLASVIPGLTISPTGVRSPIFLRGVGNNGTSTSPSVLTFIDGVYQPFDSTGADYSNVERIEVAKGPQGTLFGRNATGGVIQITTKNPLDWQGLDVQLGFANYETYSAKLYGATLLSENAAVDVAAFYDDQQEGWGVNRFDGSDFYTAERYGVRSKLVTEFDDSFSATLTGDYAYRYGQIGAGISPSTNNYTLYNAALAQSFTLPSIYDVTTDFPAFYETKEAGVALTLDKDFGAVRFLSISSYRGADETLRIDFDGTAIPFFELSREDQRRSFTQEFQLSGGSDSLTWVGGLYYYYMNSDINGPRFSGLVGPIAFGTASPDVPFAIASEDTTDAYAVYAQATMGLTPDTNLTLGARYTIETREISGQTTGSPVFSPGSAGAQEETFEEPNYRIAIDHHITPDVLIYGSWSRGFNAGFFNQIAPLGFNDVANPVVKPEEIEAYEIGIKSDLFDRHLRVNVAAFYYDYANLQQQIYQFGSITTLNAASAEIMGVDLDIVARPMRDLTLSFSANYLDSEYQSYPEAPNYDFLASGEFAAIGTRDAAGMELVGAPPFGVQAAATYTLETSFGTLDTTANVNYQQRQYADPQNEFEIPERTLLGLTEQWTSPDGASTITLWIKNLTDEEYDVSYSLLTPVGLVGNPGAPRTYGITFGHKF